MLTSETKRHIDAARQVLVGVVPNPTSQIDQITNALIYKFMDDMDQAAIKAGGESSFFVGDLERYAWSRLMDSRLGNQEKMNLYTEALVKFTEAKNLPQLFREIFKAAFLPYRSPEVLGLFLKEIDYFDYSHPEELGNAYEYLLSVMGSQGDAGQFRTPRHIIDFMVEVVAPTKDDKILDPACGTGGFLVSSFKHILQQHEGEGKKELTPDQRRKLMENFEGYDVDPGMVRIAQVNMYLHQLKNPKIYNYNTLADEDRWNDKFDVILANPPFMSPKGGVSTHNKFSVPSSRSEVLFVDYIMNHLRPKGRGGVIVPEGIIFQSGNSHKQLRKNLVEDGLYAVVSLPSGVFQPYSGVKTSILLFNNELAKLRDEVLFVKVENDGFDLGATKRPISKNDLPLALEVLNKWQSEEKIDSKLAIYVEKNKIAESGDYNLSGDRYRVAKSYIHTEWPMVELGEVCEVFNGFAFKSEFFNSQNKGIPVVRIRDINSRFSETYYSGKYDEKYIVDNGDLLIGMDGDFLVTIWKNGKALLNQRVCRLQKFKNVNKKYIYFLIQKELDAIHEITYSVTVKHISSSQIEKIKIPLPPLEIQEQIVAELDSYQNIISGARQVVENWKPVIDLNGQWPMLNLGEVADITAGQSPEGKYYNDKGEGMPFYQGKTEFTDVYIGEPKKWTTEITKVAEAGDILMSVRAPVGPVNITRNKICIGRGLAAIRAKKLKQKFLFFFLQTIQAQIIGNGGAVFDSISKNQIEQIKVPLPSVEIQDFIISKVEDEREVVEGNKRLIEMYQQKVKDVIAKLWNE